MPCCTGTQWLSCARSHFSVKAGLAFVPTVKAMTLGTRITISGLTFLTELMMFAFPEQTHYTVNAPLKMELPLHSEITV